MQLVNTKKAKRCKFPGCSDLHYGKGYCYTHYKQWRYNGKVSKINRLKEKEICSVNNCNERSIKNGLCATHVSKLDGQRTINRKKKLGVCITCGGIRDNENLTCTACGEIKRQRGIKLRIKRTNKGLCAYCGKRAITPINSVKGNLPNRKALLCEYHFFARTASNITNSTKNAQMLKDLWDDQKETCAYTGEKLTLGVTASVDHKIPKSRNGSNEKANLKWVLWRINDMKKDKTYKEFLNVCKEIVDWRRGADK